MGREVNRLTTKAANALNAAGRYGDGGGLYLVVDDDGRKRWLLRFQLHKRRRDMGLGPYPTVGVAEARQKARAAHDLIAKGLDPITARGSSAETPTFGASADALVESLAPGWRGRKTRESWDRSFQTHAKSIRAIPVDRITTDDVLSVVKPMWATLPESADKLRQRIERALDAARAQGHREGENPARWKGHLAFMLPTRKKLTRGHHRALNYASVPTFMADLRARKSMAALALEWVVLTASRETMALEATWGEIHGDVWIIPKARMKMDKDHRVPLAPAALAVLERVRPGFHGPRAFIFPGAKAGLPLSNAAMDRLLIRMKVDATPHGFRSSFRDWVGDCTEFPREIAEEALAHQVGNEVERAYRRGDSLERRRKLMEAWAAYCASP